MSQEKSVSRIVSVAFLFLILSLARANAQLTVVCNLPATAEVGVAYTGSCSASGGTAPYAYSVTGGQLPGGLSLDPVLGAVTGMPMTAGTAFSFTVSATDSSSTPLTGSEAVNNFVVAAALSLTCALPTTAQVGVSYVGASCTAVNGVLPYAYAISAGALPLGLTLNTATGAITGMPTTAGTSAFTVTVTDGAGQTTAQVISTFVVAPGVLTLNCNLPAGEVGGAYSGSCAAGGGTMPYVYSVNVGTLPAGLSLNTSTGAITGMPTSSGNFSFSVRVTDSGSPAQSASQPLMLAINPALSVTTTSLSNGVVGISYSATCAATGGTTPYTFSISSGSLPGGLSLNTSTCAITGTATASGTSNFTLKVTDSGSPAQTATQPLSITINPALTITSTSAPNGTVGVAYSFTLTAQNGTTPYTWSIVSGSLPSGLSLNSSTGVISGTPTAANTYSFTVMVTDSGLPVQTQTQSFSAVSITGGVTITTTSLPNSYAGNSGYSATLAAQNGTAPYTWSISSGALPGGLSLTAATGAITGTPNAAGTFNFTVKVTDSTAPTPQTTTQPLSITIAPALTLSLAGLSSSGIVGVPYSAACSASGGTSPYNFSISSGSLPAGLTLNTANCTISGTPTGGGGTANFTVAVNDSGSPVQSTSQAFSITIALGLTITTASVPNGITGQAYSSTLIAANGTAPYAWTLTGGTLPAGLSLSSSGTISGTPTTVGTYSFTVKVTDSSSPVQTQTHTFANVTIVAALTITTTAVPNGVVGTAYSVTLAAQNGQAPFTWSITSGALPGGLSLNASTGAITGTPTSSGIVSFSVRVTDSGSPAQSVTQPLTITIIPALSLTTTSLSNGIVGIFYSATCAATGGTTPYTFSISTGALPGGLSLNSSTCAITGTATASGTSNFTLKVTDSGSPAQTVTQALSITINPALTITSTTAPNGSVGLAYSFTLTAQNGTTPYTWGIVSGSLPSGLSLNASTGVISGTPTVANSYSFTVKVTDSGSPVQTQTQLFTGVSIAAGVTITTTSIAGSYVGNSGYSVTLAAQNGITPYTWSISSGALPGGLSLTAATGVIAGTPNAAGTFNFTVKVTDSTAPTAQTTTQALSITIASALTLTSSSLPNGFTSQTYSATLIAANGTAPYKWTETGALPSGLTLDSNGTISGTPTAVGTSSFTVKVTDSGSPAQTITRGFSITVSSGLTITTSTLLPAATESSPYSTALNATNGMTPYTWTTGPTALPAGLSLSSAGVISGTPTVPGTLYAFIVKVTDSSNPPQSATQTFNLTVNPPSVLSITTTSLGAATQSSAYSATLTAENGTAPLTWKWAASGGSTLPGGLSLSSGTGTISGVPTTPGTYTFTVTVTDSSTPQKSASMAFTLVVNGLSTPITPSFSFSGVPASETPGATLSGVTVTASPASSTAWPITLKLGFTANATGVPATYIDPALQFVSSTAPAGMTCSSATVCSVTLPANATSLSLPQIAPGTVAGSISLTLAVTGQTGASSSLTVPLSVPIIESEGVQFMDVTSSGFTVEVVANSSPRDLKTATFAFNAAPGTTISGTTTFSVDVSSLMSGWYTSGSPCPPPNTTALPCNQQFGSVFLLKVPFTFSGSSSAISSVTVTLTNSVGTSTAVTGSN
jgi:hypothetical protein